MAKIVFFCIPAHGHTNPTLPVVRALVDMGHQVYYYSFAPFRETLEAAGARFMSCDRFDFGGDVDGGKVAQDIVASTELIAKLTLSMDEAVCKELDAIRPDVIVADSAAFWGKLFAQKLGIPFVSSTTTFAFNRHSARIMKQSAGELVGMLVKLPRTARLLKPLRDRGYPAKDGLSIVQNDENTPTVVYTSREFQPCAETFSDVYHFVGPCLRPGGAPVEKSERPLLYISTGTVLSGEDRFLENCVAAFGDGAWEVIISTGENRTLDALPDNIRAYPRVDQLAVLQSADAFITHCGMNSVSEALYYGVPLALRPLTPEENGVANRVAELGAGLRPTGDDPAAIRAAVDALRTQPGYRDAAGRIADSFRRCGGAQAAAQAILDMARSKE